MENNSNSSKSFLLPLVLGWLINILGWIVFVSTSESILEILMGILCLGCIYIGYKHKQLETAPSLNLKSLSPSNLIYVSSFEAAWMFAWGLGVFN